MHDGFNSARYLNYSEGHTLAVGDALATRPSMGEGSPRMGTVTKIIGDNPFTSEFRAVFVRWDDNGQTLDHFGGDLLIPKKGI